MRQLTLHVPEELARRLEMVARDRGEHVDACTVKVLAAAVDPLGSGSDIAGLTASLSRSDRA